MGRKTDRRIKIRRTVDGKRTDRVKKAERERMLKLRNQGKTVEEIALELCRNERTVSKQLAEERTMRQVIEPTNWIDAYKLKTGKLPTMPDYLLPVIQKYSPGEPISKEIQLIRPSVRFWARLLPGQRKQLLQLVAWLGQDPEDYEEMIHRMAPPGGRHPGLRYVR